MNRLPSHRLGHTTPDAQARLARNLYALLHLPVVAGIVCIAVADNRIVTHPGRPLAGSELASWLSADHGVGLFLAGFISSTALTARTVLIERVAAGTVAVLGVCLTAEGVRRSRPAQQAHDGVPHT